MQLNRAVCLEYPEFNIPWFHNKYVEELQKRSLYFKVYVFQKNLFYIILGFQESKDIPLRIAEYLSEIVDKNMIFENIITPYGYHLNFVFSYDSNGEIVTLHSPSATKR